VNINLEAYLLDKNNILEVPLYHCFKSFSLTLYISHVDPLSPPQPTSTTSTSRVAHLKDALPLKLATMTLLDFPEELLVNIAAQLIGKLGDYAYKDLAHLASTHRRFKNLARELLLEGPSLTVALIKSDSLVASLFKYPKQARKITSLEVTTAIRDTGTSYYRPILPRSSPELIRRDPEFVRKCIKVIRGFTSSNNYRKNWIRQLLRDDPSACLGILLLMLLNLTNLQLGAGCIRQFPLLKCVVVDAGELSQEWNALSKTHRYLNIALGSLLPKLLDLELPTDWTMESKKDLKVRFLPTLYWFSALRRLTIPSHIILGDANPIPSMVLPRILERLRIVDAGIEATRYATTMVKQKFHSEGDALPNLKEIELYYKKPRTQLCTHSRRGF
jgi:hypothetical protein